MLSLARQGQLYGIEEVTYGVTPSIAATNAVRHRSFTANFDNQNKRTTNEKRQDPFINASMRSETRKSGDYSYEGILRPSGVRNTLPEVDFMLKAAFGSRTNVSLNTTAASGISVGGATLAAATGLVVKDFLEIACPDGKRRLRQIQSIAGAAVTWAPNLPTGQAPATGAAVKGVITYKLITGNLPSLSLIHYLKYVDQTSFIKRAAAGAAPDKLGIKFDANDDVTLTLSGPCKEVVDGPTQPGGFTTVGGTPASIQAGDLYINNTQMKFMSLQFELNNGLWARNDEYGETSASEIIRKTDPNIQVSLNSRAENEATLYDFAEAGTNVAVFSQTDYTEGKAIALYAPTVEFKVPSQDDSMEEVKWGFSGMGMSSADGALDAIYLALG